MVKFKVVYTQLVDANPPASVTVDVHDEETAGELIVSIKAQALRMTGVQVEGFRVDPV